MMGDGIKHHQNTYYIFGFETGFLFHHLLILLCVFLGLIVCKIKHHQNTYYIFGFETGFLFHHLLILLCVFLGFSSEKNIRS